jgi:hypothetical protein
MDLHLVGIYIKELVKINFFIVPNFGVFWDETGWFKRLIFLEKWLIVDAYMIDMWNKYILNAKY